MRERPILFSAPMVRALLAETKTQTRRVVSARHIDAAPPVHFFRYGQPSDRLWVRETHLPKASGTIYRADFSEFEAAGLGGMYGGWKPSIFCKREHSRITLEITAVRVERLQDISEADCIAEGAAGGHGSIPGYNYAATPLEHYRHIWESINGAGSWNKNPWVWVIEFKVIQTSGVML